MYNRSSSSIDLFLTALDKINGERGTSQSPGIVDHLLPRRNYSDVMEIVKINLYVRVEVHINATSLVVVIRVLESDEFPPRSAPVVLSVYRQRKPRVIAFIPILRHKAVDRTF